MTRSKHFARLRQSICLLLALLCVQGLPALYAQEDGNLGQTGAFLLTDVERQWLEAHPVVHLGVDPDFPPFEFIDETGAYKGLAADYLALLQEKLGIEFAVAPGLSWSQALEKAKNRELDALPCVGVTEERKLSFIYSIPYLSFPRVVFTRDSGPWVSKLEDLDGLLIGVQENSSHHGWIKDNTSFDPILYPTAGEALSALANGDVDAVVGNLAAANYAIRQLKITNLDVAFPIPGGSQALAFAVRKDWPEFVDILNKTLESISPEEANRIRSNWLENGPTAEETDSFPESRQLERTGLALKGIAVFVVVLAAAVIIIWILRGRPRNLSIKGTLFTVLLIFVGLTISTGIFTLLLLEMENKYADIEKQQYQSIYLAYELKQSSDDLTRFARTYAVTNDPRYESYFREIIAIRNGEIPHPRNYTPSYWDHIAAGTLQPDKDGELYSIEQKMIDLGLTDGERHKLTQAKTKSDDLTYLENTAMNAVKGLYRDAGGNFTVRGEPDLELARTILHGEEYHAAKARIMLLIDDFFTMVKQRIANELALVQKETRLIIVVVLSLALATIAFGAVTFFLLMRRIVVPLSLLKSGASALEKGDYSHHIDLPRDDEAGDLAKAFNTMTDSIKERTTKLRSIIDTAVDAIIVVSAQGTIEEFSPAAETIFGYSPAEVLGRNIAMLMPEDAAREQTPFIAQHPMSNKAGILGRRAESFGLRKNNGAFPVSVSVSEARIGEERLFTWFIRDITQRKEAEKELRILSSALEQSPVSVMITDAQGMVEYVNATFSSVTGYALQEAAGKPWRHIKSYDREDALTDRLTEISRSRKAWHGDMLSRTQTGRDIWERTAVAPLIAENGNVTHFVVVMEDITERKMQEDAKLSSLRLNQMADHASLGEILDQGLEEGIRLTESTIGYLHFVNQEQQTIALQTWSKTTIQNCSIKETIKEYSIHTAGIWADCIRNKAPVVHNDYNGISNKKGLPEGHVPVERHMAIPVLDNGSIVAVIGVGNKTTPYNQYDIDVLQLISESVWRLAQRKKSAEMITKNEKRLQLVLTSGNLGYWDRNLETKEVVVNNHLIEIFGFSPDEVDNPYDLWINNIHPDDNTIVLKAGKDYLNGEAKEYEVVYRIITKQKAVKWIVCRGATVEWDDHGKPKRMVGTMLDVTKQKEVEQELSEHMADLQKFSDIAIGREERMIDLKSEINRLLIELGREEKYIIR